MKHPFIYIGANIRTGSTLLQELLTFNNSYIFHEPWFGREIFENYDTSRDQLKAYGVDLDKIIHTGQPTIVEVLVRVADKIPQIGVKEVRNNNWEVYRNIFSNIRYIIIGRDPRDIYISRHYYVKRGKASRYTNGFNPQILANELIPDFVRLTEIYETGKAMKVKYEDLCTNPMLLEDIKKFVESPIPALTAGQPGSFLSKIERGQYEINTHGSTLTEKSVNRYDKETDENVKGQADEFNNQMKEYREFWGYEHL